MDPATILSLATVRLPDGSVHPEVNACIAALFCWELLSCGADDPVLRRCLDYLETCEQADHPGRFTFYPEAARPGWFSGRLFADVDDTALCATVLLRSGRRDRRWALDVAARLDPFRRTYVNEADRPWIRPGMYQTWLEAGLPRNPVDLCANLNVLTFRRLAGHCSDADLTLGEAMAECCAWVDGSPARLRCVSPYYFSIWELHRAWRRASDVGAAPGPKHRYSLPAERASDPLFGSDDGRFAWYSQDLFVIRRTVTSGAAAGRYFSRFGQRFP
ncbi:MAG: hypothetical protein PVI37_00380 [Gammaproteobacteria bacterium]